MVRKSVLNNYEKKLVQKHEQKGGDSTKLSITKNFALCPLCDDSHKGQIHVKWDNGSGLALIPDTDSFRRLSAKEIEAENAAKGSVVSRLTASKTQPGKEREEGRRQAKPNKKKEDMQL